MEHDEVQVAVADGVATVTLNRPDKLNAVTATMHEALRAALGRLGADESVRVIVLTGAGRGFCAGADMGRLTSLAGGQGLEALAQPAAPAAAGARADYQHKFAYFATVPQPLIACINGPAAGIGLVFALFCDLRFASTEATLMTGFARRGLIAEHGSAWALSRLVGAGHAADLLLSSRKLSGSEAERIGLVNRALPPAELAGFVQAYARELASQCSPRSLRVIKQQLWELPFQSVGQALADADRRMMDSLKTEDFKEGVAHFLEKRPPRFSGR
ncbi:MAG: enoyl-CoA hydratase [Burkholderiales bacterium]|nr:enoyl-CoA hydratase [Burkholderiales bacterium]